MATKKTTKEPAEEKPKRGRPKGSGGNKRPDIKKRFELNVNDGDNTKYIQHSLRVAGLGHCDLKNPKQVESRVIEYFQICAEDDMKPSVAGLALALDTSNQTLWDLRTGRTGKIPEVAEILKKAVQILDAQLNDYMQNGKINPVAGIFLMKNHLKYRDSTETVVIPANPLGELQSADELKRKYIEGSLVDGMALPDAQSEDEG